MAKSSCPKCSNKTFEMKENDHVQGSKYTLMFIQCSGCGAVVGITDNCNIVLILKKISEKLGIKFSG